MQVFVGRTAELDALSAVAAADANGPVAAVLVGEPGSGKSRLLAEMRSRTTLAEPFAVIGYEAERRVPLAAAVPLLRALSEAPRHGSRLDALLFDVAAATPLDPVRVFEAAQRALGEFDPAVLVVDDLQWVDELSLALCHYLIRAARDSDRRLVIFAATRPTGGPTALTDVLAPERVTWIELPPLARDEGVALALALDANIDRSLAVDLWERSKGSPFWLEALVRAGGSAAALRQVLTVRLRGAGADAANLLALLAVAGRPLHPADVAALAEWPPARVGSAVRELVERGVAVQDAASMRLAHDLIRDAALAELPDDVGSGIHRRVAERLERDAGSDLRLLREALEHRRAAGMPPLDLALRLARSPQRKLLGTDGLALLAGIADDADPFDADALALQMEVASLATELAEHEDALARWSLVADRSEERMQCASAFLAASKEAYALARVDDARRLLERSLEAGADDDALELEQRTHDAEIRLWLEQRAAEGPALAREAVDAANRLLTAAGGLDALDARARRAYLGALELEYEAAVVQNDVETMLRSAEARADAARGFDLESYLSASVAACVALRWAGDPAEAARRLRSVWAEAQRHVFPRIIVDAGFWLTRALEVMGNLDEAERIVGEASALAARAGDLPRARHRIAKADCDIALLRGDPWAALERYEQETAAEPSEHQRIVLHGDLALGTARLKGAPAAAAVHEHIAAGRACAETVGCRRCSADLLIRSAEALARIGEREGARNLLAAWDLDIHPDRINVLARSHAGALAEDDHRTRAARLETALADAERSPFRLQALWTRLDFGVALGNAKDERAVAELERTAAEAEEMGAGTIAELAGRALRALGVRTWRRAVAGAPLTERELDVARLVAEGATNREIAQRLFLSPKTIERHVSNVFKKIGVRNRAELAARVAELEREGIPR
jgi:DNA-binding CsgD family transcriptional regulator